MKSVEHLDVLLRAAYPVVLVVSHEEDRVGKALKDLVERRNRVYATRTKLYTWSSTQGMVGPDSNPDINHPVEALEFIEKQTSSCVFLLRDFMEFLHTPGYPVQRKLRDVAKNIHEGTTIVIVDSSSDVPARVEKIMTVVDFDLPTLEVVVDIALGVMNDFPKTKALDANAKAELAHRAAAAAVGLTHAEIENVFARSLAQDSTLTTKTIIEEKKAIIRKSGVLQFHEVDRGLESVGGLSNLKNWLTLRGSAFSKEARDFGLPHPKGVLILGIPGTGKSLVAKSIGAAWDMPVLRLDVGALFGSLVGQSEANMRKAIMTAETMSPCVLWIN